MSENLEQQNHIIVERHNKLKNLRENHNFNHFPNDFNRTHTAFSLHETFDHLSKEEIESKNLTVSVCGRVMRRGGPFIGIMDVSGTIQAYIDKTVQKNSIDFSSLDIGDIVGVRGVIHLSGKGEIYVKVISVDDFSIITKSLHPLPDKFNGLVDQETRYRQRYVDLIMNEDTRNTFYIRSRIIKSIREFFDFHGYLEVETPMLHPIPGGANARPFETHHNALDSDMYLRIAPELYLKKLIVGGFERVFEINRNFRNEGLSTRHNPEFTMLEFYQAYADYRDMMDITQNLIRTVALESLGTTVVNYGDSTYDFSKDFDRYTMNEAILKFNPDISSDVLSDPENNIDVLFSYAEKIGIHIDDSIRNTWGAGKIICSIFEETVESKLDQPTFITEYPWEVSPLARKNDNNPFVTDRFEFFIAGREIGNGFSELNDPIDQANRFNEQAKAKSSGDDESMYFDSDYINALEYGMPPTAGQGIGIDRLVMIFTNSQTIKDVILFPHMRTK